MEGKGRGRVRMAVLVSTKIVLMKSKLENKDLWPLLNVNAPKVVGLSIPTTVFIYISHIHRLSLYCLFYPYLCNCLIVSEPLLYQLSLHHSGIRFNSCPRRSAIRQKTLLTRPRASSQQSKALDSDIIIPESDESPRAFRPAPPSSHN